MHNRIFNIQNTNEFTEVALIVFKHQFKNNKVYRSFCDLLYIHPSNITTIEEIPFLPIPEGVEIAIRLLEFEKDFKKVKQLLKRVKKEGGEAFHEKSDKNKQVNLGGPAKTKPRKTASRNRGVERKRDARRKKN